MRENLQNFSVMEAVCYINKHRYTYIFTLIYTNTHKEDSFIYCFMILHVYTNISVGSNLLPRFLEYITTETFIWITLQPEE